MNWTVSFSIILICIIGPVAGLFISGILMGDPLLIFKTDIGGVPIISYGYITTLPIIIPASILTCGIIYIYANRRGKKRNYYGWMKDFVVLGGFIGLLTVVPFMILSFLDNGELYFIKTGIVGIFSGIFCSIPLSCMWYRAIMKE